MRFWKLTWRSGRQPAKWELPGRGASEERDPAAVGWAPLILCYRYVDEEHGERDARTPGAAQPEGLLMCSSLHFVDEEHEE